MEVPPSRFTGNVPTPVVPTPDSSTNQNAASTPRRSVINPGTTTDEADDDLTIEAPFNGEAPTKRTMETDADER